MQRIQWRRILRKAFYRSLLRQELAVLCGTVLVGMSLLIEAKAQTSSSSEEELVPKKKCDYKFTDLPRNGIMTEGNVGSLHEFVCRWSTVRDQLVHPKVLNSRINLLGNLKIDESTRSYVLEMETANMEDRANHYDEVYVVVSDKDGTYYNRLPGKRHEDGDPWHLHSLRTVDVPGAKREYLWPEFYEAASDRESDTTYAGWVAYVHTFSPDDAPALQAIDKFIPTGSSDPQKASRDTLTTSSIPIRTWDVIDDRKTEVSQIDIRFTGPDTIEVTPRTDSLTPGHKAWLGTFRLENGAFP